MMGTIKRLIQFERIFFGKTNKKRRYHMVKWGTLIRPKDFGGVGVLDTRIMNTCLLVKWIDILKKRDDSLCIQLLCKKYLGDKSIL